MTSSGTDKFFCHLLHMRKQNNFRQKRTT